MDNKELKFLIAEDEFIIALEIKQLLEDMGFKVTSLVSTALEAITRSELDKPDIILMDVLLGGSLNGIEAAGIIKYKHNIPIIFLTDRTNEHILTQNRPNNSYLSIKKPIDILQLSELMKQVQKEALFQPISYNNTSRPTNYSY